MNAYTRMAGSDHDLLHAVVYGDTIDALKTAALTAARALYGEEAPLQIEQVGPTHTPFAWRRGRFCADVDVRCLDLPKGWTER